VLDAESSPFLWIPASAGMTETAASCGNEPEKTQAKPGVDTGDTALLKGSQGFIKHAESSQWTKEKEERPDGLEERCA